MNLGAIYRQQWFRFKVFYARWFAANLALFVLSGIVGYLYIITHPQAAEAALKFVMDKMPQFQPGQSLFLIILERNSLASLTFVILGLITGGALTLLSIVVNGGMVGALLGVLGIKGTVNPLKLLFFGIIPHGILEIPAIALAGGLGMRLGILAVQRVTGKGVSLKGELRDTLATFVFVIIPVLVAAALVESTVTPVLVKTMLPEMK